MSDQDDSVTTLTPTRFDGRQNLTAWEKGKSGNPSGLPKWKTMNATEYAKTLETKAVRALEKILENEDEKFKGGDIVSAAKLIIAIANSDKSVPSGKDVDGQVINLTEHSNDDLLALLNKTSKSQ